MSARPQVVWLSGRYLPAERARVPATSDSVLLGVGAFETMRLVGGAAPLLDLHLERLHGACAALGLGRSLRMGPGGSSRRPSAKWAPVLAKLAERNRPRNGIARITVGDGFVLISCRGLERAAAGERKQGVALTTRRFRRGAARIKGTSRLDLWLAERDAGGEILLVDHLNRIFETSRASFFAVTADGLETAAPPHVLGGIGLHLVGQAAEEAGIALRHVAPALHESSAWREAFVTNAVYGVRPVREIDGHPLAGPVPGSVSMLLQSALDRRLKPASG